MSKKNIVVFTGRAGSGKDTAAAMLGADHHLYFAKALKSWGLYSLKIIMEDIGLDTHDDLDLKKRVFGTQQEKEAPLPLVNYFGIQMIYRSIGIITLGASMFAGRGTAAILIGLFGGLVTWLQSVSFTIRRKDQLTTRMQVALARTNPDIVSDCVDNSAFKENLYKLLGSIRVEHYPTKGDEAAFVCVACSVLGVLWSLFGRGIWMACVPYVVALNYFAQIEGRFVTIKMNDGSTQLLTGRRLLQLMGTEVVRNSTKEGKQNLWPAIVMDECNKIIKCDHDAKIVITDCRFLDEIELLNGFEARVIHIKRDNNPTKKMEHASEATIDKLPRDMVIDNSGSIDKLQERMGQVKIEVGW